MNLQEISSSELNRIFDEYKKSKAFGAQFRALSKEVKRRANKALADGYRDEFSSLSDGTILSLMSSFSEDKFITLTEYAEAEAKKFDASQPF
jgi:hypothetical protein